MDKSNSKVLSELSEAVKKVQWFLDNLELQIEERKLREEGISTVVLFDTASVRGSLLGMEKFLTAKRTFDIRAFNQKPALVHALASAGWLGAMHALLPHQNEFMTQANLDFGSEPNRRDFGNLTHRFLQALKIDREIVNSTHLGRLDQEDRIKFVRQNVGSAEKLFKAIQFIRGSWRTKLVDWLDTKQLVMLDDDIDIADILGSSIYHRLYKSFHSYRRDVDVNNSVDAIALSELAEKLRAFCSNRRFLPVLFSPTGFFEKVVAKAGLQSHFQYTTNDRVFGVIRSSDYFIFKAIFNRPETFVHPTNEEQMVLASTSALSEFKDRVAHILKARSSLEEALDQVTGFGDRTLGKLIEDIRNLTFFENVWLPLSSNDLEQVEQELQEAAKGLRSEAYIAAADEALARAKQEIESKTRTYRELTNLWQQLGSTTNELLRRFSANNEKSKGNLAGLQEFDPFLHFGLLRFSLPRSSHLFIRKTLAALISNDATARRDAQLRVVDKYRLSKRDGAPSEELLAELAGVLWCLDLNRELVAFLEAARPLPSFSLELMLAAAYFRTNQKVGEGNLLLRELKERYEGLPAAKLGQLMIGLAYLNFHLILSLRLLRDPALKEAEQGLFSDAITCARSAYRLLQDSPARVYALNCCLYYMVERGDESSMEDMYIAAEDLKRWIDKPGVWQFRFDDTLARYYYFVSRFTSSDKTREIAIDQAFVFIERAWHSALGDPEVLSFRGQLAGGSVKRHRNEKGTTRREMSR